MSQRDAFPLGAGALDEVEQFVGVDPETGKMERLFNPRGDEWRDHFRIDGPKIVGLTAVGRTTISLLEFNTVDRVELRAVLIELNEWP